MPNKDATNQVQAAPKRTRRSEYVLLNRAMDRADEQECEFLYDFLDKCATAPLTIQEAALACASNHFKLGIGYEDLQEDGQAEIIRSLRWMEVKNPWLYRLIYTLAHATLAEKDEMLQPDDVAFYLDIAITDVESELRIARDALLEHPEALAADIRKAAAALPAEVPKAK